MEKKQIENEVMIADLQKHLPSDEREAGPELEKETLNVIDEGLFDLALLPRIRGTKEIEKVRILEHLRGHVRIRGRKRGLEVGEGLAVAHVSAAVDLEGEDVAGPSVLSCGFDVPFSGGGLGNAVEQHAVMKPWDLCSNLLHKWAVGPRCGKGSHILQISR